MKTVNIIFLLLIITSTACSQQNKNNGNGGWRSGDEIIADAPDQKAVKGFGAVLTVVRNPREFIKEWEKPEMPWFDSAKTVKPDEQLGIIVLFAGCRPDSKEVCNTEVDYTVYKPDGKILFKKKGLELWKTVAPPKPNTQLGKAIIKLEMQKSDLAGEYKVKAKVYDKNADISFELETQFTLETK